MGYEVEVTDLTSQQTAAVRLQIRKNELGDTFGKVLPEVFGYLGEQNKAPAGPPFGRYFKFSDEGVDVEIGLPVSDLVEGNERIKPSELPEGKAAKTVHVGSYDNLPQAYEFLHKWIESSDEYEPGDAPWESYVKDPGDHSDHSLLETEVYWPLQPKS